MWGPGGTAQLDALELPDAYAYRIESLRDLIIYFDRELDSLDARIHAQLKNDPGYRAIQQIDGVGRVLGAISWPRSETSAGSLTPSTCARGRA
jgi:hypothetical protein